MSLRPSPRPRPPSTPGTRSKHALFVNRELSFLEFNQRIVEEAADSSVPLLERLKFIGIVSANLDEFFMVRVAGLKQQLKSGVLETGPDGMLPSEQLKAIDRRVRRQHADQEQVLLEDVFPRLRDAGIRLVSPEELRAESRAMLDARFEQRIFPILTPLAVDPGHPFPFLKNRTLNLAVSLLPEASPIESVPLLAVVQVPAGGRFVPVDGEEGVSVMFIEDAITANIGSLFPGMRILECIPFRVVRNWDLQVDEDEQEDLLEVVQKELRRRSRLDAVRLDVSQRASPRLVERLRIALDLGPSDVHAFRGPLALADLHELLESVGRSDLRDEGFQPILAGDFRGADDLFQPIRQRDILLHHPYESYEPVLELLDQAADDPATLAIKQTLYRVNRHSPILRSLIRAAENGKQVTALVELKARFDEETNVEWARILEEAGVNVVYGMMGLKTHCKVTLIVRKEPDCIRRYVHLGTGNYNEKTATIYSDLSFFTTREDVGRDMASLFNLLTGYSEPPVWEKLVVAPLELRQRVLFLINRTRDAAVAGESARIVIKSNALIDPRTIEALCEAAAAGAEVTLLIRGPCTLRPGLPGQSDGITVRMIIDRYLEHSRVLYFAQGSVEDLFITSTDIMPRNFDRRIEVMLPIEDETLKRRIVDELVAFELRDNVKAAALTPEGTFERVPKPAEGQAFRAQAAFIELARGRARAAGKDEGRRGARRVARRSAGRR